MSDRPSSRLNDSLNCVLFADEYDPSGVMRGSTSVASKDGLPLQMYAPATGWLGPISWVAEHLADLGGREHAVPDYYSTPAGQPSRPGTVLREGVAGPDLMGLLDLVALATVADVAPLTGLNRALGG